MHLLGAALKPLGHRAPVAGVSRGAGKKQQLGGRIQNLLSKQSDPMARRFHLALSVADLTASIADYSARLGIEPECVVPGEYALWRTEGLNLSIRVVSDAEAGHLRHLGWEEPEATAMETSLDVNGILWERFSRAAQRQEIKSLWGAAARFRSSETDPAA